MLPRQLPTSIRARGATAVLGPTNTGKTHLAIERMLGHESGLIGLPLRLLAREVYARVADRVGADAVALVTGEEKIKPPKARYWVATVEAMPRDLDVAFVAIDEAQLAADLDRGHVFTDRLLNMRGSAETLLIGAATIKPLIEKLVPGAHMVSRPRLSKLTFAGEKKLTRLPRRSAIVAFSAEEVYAIAELIRRQSGGAAVVLGALSPRTRNAQVALYQSGDVDYLVATDAIGMGLNLDVDHVAFAADRKFDGVRHRRLAPAEFGQIAGRAGRHLNDGTFGTTGRCAPFEPELVEAIENHAFEALRVLQWRNAALDFASIARLQNSLDRTPVEEGLTRAPPGEDVLSLDILARDPDIRDLAAGAAAVERLWEVCQVPDYRKVAPQAHAALASTLYVQLMRQGRLDADWFSRRLAELDRVDGDIDTLSARIAQVRTWTFVANRPDWLGDPEHWQQAARQVEDRLSDALHERLAQRFVDRRTSVLMRRLRENAMLESDITTIGDVLVEGLHVGRLQGFQFVADPQAGGPEAKALRAAAQKALAAEFEARAERVAMAVDEAFVLANDGALRFVGEVVARLSAGEKLLEPRLRLLADDLLTPAAREKVQARIDLWLKAHIEKWLGLLLRLEAAETLTGAARGLAFQIGEALGVLERSRVAEDMKHLDQEGRAALRALGIRFGAYHLTIPALLKPAPRGLAAQLWALKHGGAEVKGLDDILHLAGSGRTSMPVDKEVTKGLYRAAGFRICGERALRVDILERLADLIRPAIHFRPGITPGPPPAGAADGEGFVVTTAMTSLCGCAGEDFASILRSLGYVSEKRQARTIPAVPADRVNAAEPETAAAQDAGTVADAANKISADEAPGGSASLDPAPADGADEAAVPAADSTATSSAPPPDSEVAASAATAEWVGADATQAQTSAEMALIEIWSQRRAPVGHRQVRREDRGKRSDGAPSQRHRSLRREVDAPTTGAGAPHDGAAARADASAPKPERSGDRRDQKPRGRPDQRRGDRPERFKGSEGRPGTRMERREGPAQERRPPREKAPDPDSPFAKLLALKAELEARKGNS